MGPIHAVDLRPVHLAHARSSFINCNRERRHKYDLGSLDKAWCSTALSISETEKQVHYEEGSNGWSECSFAILRSVQRLCP